MTISNEMQSHITDAVMRLEGFRDHANEALAALAQIDGTDLVKDLGRITFAIDVMENAARYLRNETPLKLCKFCILRELKNGSDQDQIQSS